MKLASGLHFFQTSTKGENTSITALTETSNENIFMENVIEENIPEEFVTNKNVVEYVTPKLFSDIKKDEGISENVWKEFCSSKADIK